jgi:hypothetical protein
MIWPQSYETPREAQLVSRPRSLKVGADHNMGRKPWAKALRLISLNALAYGLARLMIDACK